MRPSFNPGSYSRLRNCNDRERDCAVGWTLFRPGILTRASVSAILLVVVMMLVPAEASAAAEFKDPPDQVTVEGLVTQPDQYDGRRVIVTGRIRQIESHRGRRGGEFLMLILEGEARDSSGESPWVGVFSFTLPDVGVGERALIQGVYHREAMEAGRMLTNFIDAEAILRD